MSRFDFYKIAWVLVGLLAICAGLISLGDQSIFATPSGASLEPSGAAAFAQFLRVNGYPVVVSYSTSPDLRPNDVAVAFFVEGQNGSATAIETRAALAKFVEAGGAALILSLPRNVAAVDEAKAVPIQMPSRVAPYNAILSGEETRSPSLNPDEEPGEEYDFGAMTEDRQFASLYKDGKGLILEPLEGVLATNRFIDKYDDATLLLMLTKMLAKPGARIVFAEGAWGNASSPSFIELAGPWALGAWRQAIFLGVVVIFTLGKRFGIARSPRVVEQGSRELVEAVASVYEKSRAAIPALEASIDRAQEALRRHFKVGNADEQTLAKLAPEAVVLALQEAIGLSKQAPSPREALSAARRLDAELEEFL